MIMLKYIKAVEALQAFNNADLDNEIIEDALLENVTNAFNKLDSQTKHMLRLSTSAQLADIIFA
jgi:hypothetical protein